jgi:dipeptidyl aminopeptidase/acylaminoacyl peptidase
MADLDTGDSVMTGHIYDGVNRLNPVQNYTYTAADGEEIPAVLVLPALGKAENLPLVVLPHGGPQVQDTLQLDWWAQALADRGYAVLKPNYRGSDLNAKWVTKGYGEWGRKMQTDLSDGVAALAKQGVIDPARVSIAGASYGGYAALAGVSLQHGIYRCAVSLAGVSNPGDMLSLWQQKVKVGDSVEQRYWKRFMGVQGSDDSSLNSISPLKHADAVRVPVLLIHGEQDTVVPFAQSDAMFKALKALGRDVSLVTLSDEDHWMSRPETRLKMLQSMVEFMGRCNPP